MTFRLNANQNEIFEEYKRSRLSRNINLGSKNGSVASLKEEDRSNKNQDNIPSFFSGKNQS